MELSTWSSTENVVVPNVMLNQWWVFGTDSSSDSLPLIYTGFGWCTAYFKAISTTVVNYWIPMSTCLNVDFDGWPCGSLKENMHNELLMRILSLAISGSLLECCIHNSVTVTCWLQILWWIHLSGCYSCGSQKLRSSQGRLCESSDRDTRQKGPIITETLRCTLRCLKMFFRIFWEMSEANTLEFLEFWHHVIWIWVYESWAVLHYGSGKKKKKVVRFVSASTTCVHFQVYNINIPKKTISKDLQSNTLRIPRLLMVAPHLSSSL